MSDKFTIHEDMSFLNPNFEINREFKKSYPNNGKRKTESTISCQMGHQDFTLRTINYLQNNHIK